MRKTGVGATCQDAGFTTQAGSKAAPDAVRQPKSVVAVVAMASSSDVP
jgi:hypothetical protein